MIELGDNTGRTFHYRVVPSMTTSGCLLNPEVTDDDQLLFAARGNTLPRYRWLKITTKGGDKLFKKNAAIRFSTLPDFGSQGNAL
jgi:hypothetical protein